MNDKKHIEVVAAVIRKDDKVFCCQRGPKGECAFKWEFPGGKIEPGETKEEALIREIKEELNCEIKIKDFIMTVYHEYNSFLLTMHVYLCELNDEQLVLNVHQNFQWCDINKLYELDFADADLKVLPIFNFKLKHKLINNISDELNNFLMRYISAQQFKNAISSSYIYNNNKSYNRSIPYIVNLVFSLEILLKLYCTMQKIKYNDTHKIRNLLHKSNLFKFVKNETTDMFEDKHLFDIEIYKINNAFYEWRYSYETDDLLMVDDKFLNRIIEIVDNKIRGLISQKYDFDFEIIDKLY